MRGAPDIDSSVMVSSFNKVAAGEMSVLVVDDHPSMRDMLVTSLRRRGCRSESASGGYEALDWLAVSSFDIVLLDLWMEDLTGLEVLRQIRSQIDPESASPLPFASSTRGPGRFVDGYGVPKRQFPLRQRVVMMSANADDEDRNEARAHGVHEFLDKPIEMTDLWRALVAERTRDSRPGGHLRLGAPQACGS